MTLNPTKWTVKTDGGCPANPGPGAFAFVIEMMPNGKKITRSGFLPLPTTTNNQAEYRAVEAAARFLGSLPHDELPLHIEFWSDSELIVNQIKGKYRVQSQDLLPFYHEAKDALKILHERGIKLTINWFRRENNEEADELCNLVLEKRGIVLAKKRKKNVAKI